ncbi:RNA pseudouridylate synthase domain-containing protein 2 [Galendromus occidentalis]|uniref:Pseudouridine synthase n=1 Tax=Galendromus occidentalis TaxID=34638 RepID=A0AAJ6QYU3_9ACAR|nr:RNA pseudouridylate synthase domain-containing protein 2 [Galendromus occidentalis]
MSTLTEVKPVAGEIRESTDEQNEKRKLTESGTAAGTDDTPEAKRMRTDGSCENRESGYYFQNGLRKVYPYMFQYQVFAKGRWVGRTVLDVFSTEFRAHSKEYYEEAIKSGQIRVNGEPVDLTYRFKDNDKVTNETHRHEVPVIGCPIKIIYEDKNMLVVDKPPSIPVHPCSRYRLNSMLKILSEENGYSSLHTLHRLDRLTSGVLMFAKTKERSLFMDELIRTRHVTKQYLCRVRGEFPDGEITVAKPIEVYSYKIGVSGVKEGGRDCTTIFEKLSFNGKSSVVLARPKQGRMHQIRVHLQYLGHPIVRDPLYNDEAFGSNRAKGGLTEKTPEELVDELMKRHTLENWLTPMSDAELENRKATFGQANPSSDTPGSPATSSAEDFFKNYPENLEHYITDDFRKTLRGYDPSKMQYVESCPECQQRYIDPSPEDLTMYLHCYSYKGEDFEYTASWPNWAREDWVLD